MIKKIKIFLSKKQQTFFVILLFGICISAGLEMIGIGLIPVFIKLLLNPDQLISYLPSFNLKNFFTNKSHIDQILVSVIFLSSFFIIKNLFIFSVGYFQASVFRDIKVKNAKRLFQAYLYSPYSLHLNINPAIINRNIIGELELGTSHLSSLMQILREVLLIAVIFFLLLLANPTSSLIAFFVIGLLVVIFYFAIKKKMTYLSKISQVNRGRRVQLINEVFGAIKDTKILSKESFFTNEFKNETEGAERVNFFSDVINIIPRLSMEIFAVITILIITLFLLSGGGSIDNMLPMIGLLGIATIRIMPSFNVMALTLTKMRRSIVSFDVVINELKKLEKSSSKVIDFKKSLPANNLFEKKDIELKNITYQYPNSNKKVLKNITFNIKSGNYIAIIGKTGSGKSTLASIILGLLDPTEGQIIVNNYDIKENYLAWQKKIGYISQDIYLLDASIKRNVAFGVLDKEIDDSKVNSCIRLAQLDDLIQNLPLGFNTMVGDRGVRISGGQKQRIGIARALYRKSEVLVLDEATSSLDFNTEKKLIKDIERLRGKYTIITITHRLEAIKNCDEAFLLSDGKLVDRGTVDHLILKNKELIN